MNSERVSLNGIEMYYESEGAGEPLLLLHGGTGSQENWKFAGQERLAHEYRLIRPDARGHGRTTNPAKTITHRQCASVTLAFAAQFTENALTFLR